MSEQTVQDELAFGLDAPLREVMRTMRAIRRLKPDPVPRDLLEQIVEAATWAPSGGNTQSYSFVVVTDRATIASLEPLWRRCYELYMGTVARTTPQSMDEEQARRLYAAVTYQRDHFAEIPALIIACYDLRWQRRQIMSDWRAQAAQVARTGWPHAAVAAASARRAAEMAEAASVYPGVQNMLLTARALGLGATLTNWHLLFERDFKKALGIPAGVKTFALIPVGWPRGRFGPVRRRSAAESIHWDRWSDES